MDPEELYAWLETLSDEEREQALYDFGFADANQVPMSYGGGDISSPMLDYNSFDLTMMNELPPELNKQGEVMPWGLDQQQQAFNTLQDLGAMTVDNALAMYGGAGSYDANAFADQTIPIGQPIDMSGSRYLNTLAESGAGYESFLAQLVRDGMTPGAAVAKMWEFINEGGEDEVDPEAAALRESLIASLPPSTSATDPVAQLLGAKAGAGTVGDLSTPEGRMATTDVGGINKFAADLFEKKVSDPEAGYTDPSTGLSYLGARSVPSEMGEKFRKAGIPTPDESYMDEEWLNAPLSQDTVLGRQEREAAAQDRYAGTIGLVNQQQAGLDELEKAWMESEDEREALERERREAETYVPERTDSDIDPYGLGASSLLRARSNAGEELVKLRQAGEGAPVRGSVELGPSNGWPTSEGSRQREAELARMNAGFDTQYDLEYDKWDDANRDRLLEEAYIQEAKDKRLREVEGKEVDNPYVVSSGEEILGTYDFAGTPEEEENLGRFAAVLGSLGGGGRRGVRVGRMNEGTLNTMRRGLGTARQGRQNALDYQIRQHEITSPEEIQRASSIGRAMAMQRQGRTPMNDVLMQRALARRSLIGY